MDLEQVVARELRHTAGESDGTLERRDACEYALDSQVARVVSERCLGQASMREDEALDARGRDRLGAQELTCEPLEVDERGRVFVQVQARLLRVRGCGGDV